MTEKSPQPETVDDEAFSADTSGAALKLLVLAFVLLLVGGGVVFLIFWPDFSETGGHVGRTRPVFEDFETLLKTGDVPALTRRSVSLQSNKGQRSLPEKTERMGQRIQIADRLLELSDDSETIEFAINSKIESLSLLQETNIEFGIPSENVRDSLIELTTEGSQSDNSEVRAMSHIALVVLYINEYEHDESRFDVCKRQLELSAGSLTQDVKYATKLMNIVRFLNRNKQNDQRLELKNIVVRALLASEIPDIRAMGESATLLNLDAKYDFKSLVSEFEYADDDWYERIENYLSEVETIQGLPQAAYVKAIMLLESLLRIEKNDLAQEYFLRLKSFADQLDDGERKKFLISKLHDYEVRVQSIGEPLLLEGTDVLGNPVSIKGFEDKVTAILFYNTTFNRSFDYLSAISELDYLHDRGARFVCVGINEQGSDKAIPMAEKYQRIIWMNLGDTPSLVESFPLLFTPYLIVVGRDGKLTRINVGLDSLRLAIEANLGE